jgi:alkylhydroperoxidase/carboxymuconolactone decarboxylase family protein YurZ
VSPLRIVQVVAGERGAELLEDRDELRSHLARAHANGVTRDELIEAITHLAFYAGWPSAVMAVGVAKEVLPQR